ncbi:DNA repair protein RadA [Pseudemcibacter aquimaris]|uniref:DNA repair protein RadA n=1 Tax=Pseudemcibacter aquimaris TaxID=2857064 RepID=UPI002011966F|nr:DNA repair protein RadA [Pseudemcibacter aquimaris]MCC3859988.1 DNA repair protein RadA [Pseudemcibacter aquimaris]WDU57319.1 DNA repair protein RadA [Pseudemcibacter aquimaris]
MARPKRIYVCNSCGSTYSKWAGQCEGCGEWNTLTEEASENSPTGLGKSSNAKGNIIELSALKGEDEALPRMKSGIGEFDRVTGGGLVPGSAILIGGDPGIGKSTILLQSMSKLADGGHKTVYISGEESVAQVRMRAKRLGLAESNVELGSETNLRDILATLSKGDCPDVVVIDSIQTMYADTIESAPGTVAQVRTSAQELIRFAKKKNVCVLLVGHVTKDGQIAGPRVMEHMVDTVLYFEGDRGHQFRILRAVKNRFGGTDEIGVFEMGELGLSEVSNPSALFLGDRDGDVVGSAVFAGMEGSRPMLVEVQALVAQSSLGTPRRAVVGWDSARLAMIIAVLDARCGLGLGAFDIYLNVAGGLKISEPAADLAVAAALISSLSGDPIAEETVIFGEIALSGEIRPVGQADARLKEAEKLGFTQAFIPSKMKFKNKKIKTAELDQLIKLVDIIAPNLGE